jgi:hypothetical protein
MSDTTKRGERPIARLAIVLALVGCEQSPSSSTDRPSSGTVEQAMQAPPSAAAPLARSFYCFTVGNAAGRECLENKARCEALRNVGEKNSGGCFAVEKAYCFSKLAITGDGRENVCTPTAEECTRWTKSFEENGRKPSACTLSTHAEVWP